MRAKKSSTVVVSVIVTLLTSINVVFDTRKTGFSMTLFSGVQLVKSRMDKQVSKNNVFFILFGINILVNMQKRAGIQKKMSARFFFIS
jgi:hypothetical protein